MFDNNLYICLIHEKCAEVMGPSDILGELSMKSPSQMKETLLL